MFFEDTYRFVQRGDRFSVRCLRSEEVTPSYVTWLNDDGNKRFLGTVGKEAATLEGQRAYAQDIYLSDDRILLALHSDRDGLIGTSGAQRIGHVDARTGMGILLGDPNYRGRGLGAAWVWVAAHVLFVQVDIDEIAVRILSLNTPSIRSFARAGFQPEGTEKGVTKSEDRVLMGCSRGTLVDSETIEIEGLGRVSSKKDL